MPTIDPFTPGGSTSLSVSSVSSNVAIPNASATQQLVIYNSGSLTAYVALGTGSSVAATTSSYPLAPGAKEAISIGSSTYIAAITASSTTTLAITSGDGFLDGFGGGGSSSTPSNPLPVEITDGTNGIVAVKAASTAPAAADKALVVGISPNGQLAAGQAASSASVPVVPASDYYPPAATYKHIAAGQATTVVKAAPGVLYSIVFNTAATATNVTTIYDNASGSGTVIAIPAATTATIPGLTLEYGPNGVAFTLGLTIITGTANGADMTVVYR